MALFTVRVVLRDNASREQFAFLHSQMVKSGFTDLIKDDHGRVWIMPPAEYDFEGNATIDQVYEAARRAAGSVGVRFQVFVSEATRRMWIGLDLAPEARRIA